jgi:hypothetical protein
MRLDPALVAAVAAEAARDGQSVRALLPTLLAEGAVLSQARLRRPGAGHRCVAPEAADLVTRDPARR